MTEDLIILGTGVHAAEMVEIVDRVNRLERTWNLLGFIARDPSDAGKAFNGTPVLGTFSDLPKFPGARFVPANHNKLPWPMGVPVERMASLVDPGAFVSRTARLGRGCVVYPGCFVGLHAVLGDFVFVLANSVLNHDVVLEERVLVNSGVVLAGRVHVGENARLGQACAVRESIKIGRDCQIGMGAVVVKDVPPGCVMVGNPARKLRDHIA